MNASVRSIVLGTLAALVLSGCVSGGEEGLPVTTSMAPPPAPKVVLSDFAVHACPGVGGAPPVQTASLRERFIVEDGFDQLIIDYGETGEGQVAASIRYVEENKNVWEEPQHAVNTAPDGVTCGAHGNHGPGEEVMVEPGEYEANIQYTGTVDVVMSVTARSTRGNMTDHAGHMG